MRHMHRPATGLQNRQDVRAYGIASHQSSIRPIAVTSENVGVNLGRLFGDDFNAIEVIAQTRQRKLALLIEQIALCDLDNAMGRGQGFDGLDRMGEQFDGMR